MDFLVCESMSWESAHLSERRSLMSDAGTRFLCQSCTPYQPEDTSL